MSGTPARPAAASVFGAAAIWAGNWRRPMVVVVAVVAAHAFALTIKNAPSGGHTAPAAASSVMAIRVLRPSTSVAEVVPPPLPSAVPAAPLSAAHAAPVESAQTSPSAAAQLASRSGRVSERDGAASKSGSPTDVKADGQLAAAPDYALGVRLDPGPRPLEDIEPDYPDMTSLREGVVVLRLLISESGHVDDVGIVRAEPRGIFEEAAVEAFSKARFSPGLAAGRPVKSQITVEVQFMPINRGARVSGRTY
jgi:periplasmic protein TonB